MKKHLPNILSLIRMGLIIPIIFFFVHQSFSLVAISILIALLTDFADGYLARKWEAESNLGRILDPLSDKLIMAASCAGLLITGKMPLWFFLAVLFRDICILLLSTIFRKRVNEVPEADIFGKFYFVGTIIIILLVLVDFPPALSAGYYVATTALLVSSLSYIMKLIHFIK